MTNIDFKSACEIMENDVYSNFEKITSEKHIILPPRYLGQIKKGVTEQLNSEVGLVSELFDGVLIAYSNLKLKQRTGLVLDEMPFIHFDIEADFIVFKPGIGCTLRAKVNKISKNHIGCLVHECFNASIPKPRHVTDSWKGFEMSVGDEVLFVVDKIYTQNRVLSIRGHLKDNSTSGHKHNKKRCRRLSFDTTANVDSSKIRVNDNTEEISRAKKMKSESDLVLANSLSDSLEVTEKDRKHKKKRKHKIEMESESLSQSYNVLNLNSSEHDSLVSSDTKKHKKAKKRKHSHGSSSMFSLSQENSDDGTDISAYIQGEHSHRAEDTSNSASTPVIESDINKSDKKVKKHKKHKNKNKLSEVSYQDNVLKTDTDISSSRKSQKQKKQKHTESKNEDIDTSLTKNIVNVMDIHNGMSSSELNSSFSLSQSISHSPNSKKHKKKKKKEKS